MQREDPRYRGLDRVLARAYIALMHRWNAARKRLERGFLVPRYAIVHASPYAGLYRCRMDLRDDPADPHIFAMLEVPGMRREELLLQVKDSRLIIEGERIASHDIPQVPGPRSSSSNVAEVSTPPSLYPIHKLKYGKVKREIALPAGVDVGASQ